MLRQFFIFILSSNINILLIFFIWGASTIYSYIQIHTSNPKQMQSKTSYQGYYSPWRKKRYQLDASWTSKGRLIALASTSAAMQSLKDGWQHSPPQNTVPKVLFSVGRFLDIETFDNSRFDCICNTAPKKRFNVILQLKTVPTGRSTHSFASANISEWAIRDPGQ